MEKGKYVTTCVWLNRIGSCTFDFVCNNDMQCALIHLPKPLEQNFQVDDLWTMSCWIAYTFVWLQWNLAGSWQQHVMLAHHTISLSHRSNCNWKFSDQLIGRLRLAFAWIQHNFSLKKWKFIIYVWVELFTRTCKMIKKKSKNIKHKSTCLAV